MATNSLLSSDDAVVDRMGDMLAGIMYGVRAERNEMGAALEDYLADAEHGNWEGFSDAEIIAIYTFLADLGRYADQA